MSSENEGQEDAGEAVDIKIDMGGGVPMKKKKLIEAIPLQACSDEEEMQQKIAAKHSSRAVLQKLVLYSPF